MHNKEVTAVSKKKWQKIYHRINFKFWSNVMPYLNMPLYFLIKFPNDLSYNCGTPSKIIDQNI